MNSIVDEPNIVDDFVESQDILISFIDGYNTMKKKFNSEILTIDSNISELNIKIQSYSQYFDDNSSVFSPFSDVDDIKNKCDNLKNEIDNLNSKKVSLIARIDRIDSQIEQLSFVLNYITTQKQNLSQNNTVSVDSVIDNDYMNLNENFDLHDTSENKNLDSTEENSVDITEILDISTDICDSLAFVDKILPADPMRAKIEIREIIKKVSRET